MESSIAVFFAIIFIRVRVSNPKETTNTRKAQTQSIPKAELFHACPTSTSETGVMGVRMKGEREPNNLEFNKISPSDVPLGFVTQISQYSVNTNLNTTPNSQVNWDNGNSPTKKHQWDTRGFFLYHNLSNNVFLNLLGHQPKFKAINLERTRYTAGAGVQGQASRDDWAEHRARPQPCSWASGSSFSGAALPGRRRFPP